MGRVSGNVHRQPDDAQGAHPPRLLGQGIQRLAEPAQYVGVSRIDDGDRCAVPLAQSVYYVAGEAALVKSRYPLLSVGGLRDRLLKTADDVGAKGRDVYTNWGRINAWKAVGK